MTDPTWPPLPHLAALADGVRRELAAAEAAGHADAIERLRGELALLEDLALPEAMCELRLQRIAYAGAAEAMTRPLPPALLAFLA